MVQDDPEQRIADLERQLAEAKAAADSQENRTGANAAAAPPPFTAPPQAPPPQAAAWNPQPPMMAPPTFGPPLAQPLGQAAFGPPGVGYNSIGLRVVRFLLHGLWWAGIGCVGFAVYLGIKVHRVSLDGQSARCGNVFDAIFKHNAYYGADTLRSACSDQVAKAQTMTYGLIVLGAVLIFASLVVLVISWIMKWRQGWRPWRPYGPYGRRYTRGRSLGGANVVGGILDNIDWR
jgi:hypothetical protein